MNDKLKQTFSQAKNYWNQRTKKQKIFSVSGVVLFILLVALVTYFATRTSYAPLYSGLEASETGSIKEELDNEGVQSKITDGGKTIEVPKDQVDNLKVKLAAEGLPKTGSIDYSFFSQNSKFGMTDNEFNVVKLDAMQTELSNLIEEMDGINKAKVMINLPNQGVFVSDGKAEASASIVLNVKPGFNIDDKQIKAMYNLVSKSVPNLPTDNIVIMNQNFEYYDLNSSDSSGDAYTEQMNIKHQIERDIQQRVQTMLSTLMGTGKAVVNVTADIDFTQEQREENLVEPVDKTNMKGIEISAKNIAETYKGTGAAGGVTEGSSSTDSLGSSYQSGTSGNGDYNKTDDTINYEVNRIKRKIVESPYKIRDLGIEVMVEPPNRNKKSSLPASRVNDIKNMLSTIVRTSIDKSSGTNLSNNSVANKISVSVEPFAANAPTTSVAKSSIPWWIYAIGGALLLIIALLIFFMLRARRKRNELLEDEEELLEEEPAPVDIPDVNKEVESESTARRKQLEKLAKEKPDEFAKLLRTWISED
ncbi:flagellar basal-body MS-ring/collar protein FliF [Heyndrickxia ginsengihumi]|uniref:flagellar basal-body MS-ring/collar protein FliF n=1 Tax=Heyndrickxia ginsengihumi TaxID=363870 RepID=UPI0004705C03|nr:flagellar basal-body MS-ring/collar protein FliF [Heyndrickxia ginsengihumi]MBE6183864.1 flagellar basal body M-ring protein FliF [Bacillus sp. (in: firmicutes)]MCM3022490.1 flagellar M-ring protein FliF [Heyndrickxia ginsengihumi]